MEKMITTRHRTVLWVAAITLLTPLQLAAESDQSTLAPWERVEVVPGKQAARAALSSKEVTVEFNNITRVIVYVTGFCTECDKVMNYLRDHKVAFTEQYVLNGAGALWGLLSGTETPTTKFIYRDGSSRKVIGFDEEILKTIIQGGSNAAKDDSFEISDFELGTHKK